MRDDLAALLHGIGRADPRPGNDATIFRAKGTTASGIVRFARPDEWPAIVAHAEGIAARLASAQAYEFENLRLARDDDGLTPWPVIQSPQRAAFAAGAAHPPDQVVWYGFEAGPRRPRGLLVETMGTALRVEEFVGDWHEGRLAISFGCYAFHLSPARTRPLDAFGTTGGDAVVAAHDPLGHFSRLESWTARRAPKDMPADGLRTAMSAPAMFSILLGLVLRGGTATLDRVTPDAATNSMRRSRGLPRLAGHLAATLPDGWSPDTAFGMELRT